MKSVMDLELPQDDDLKMLIGRHPAPCVSVYMPTYFLARETWQDPIRYRNLLREVDDELNRRKFFDRRQIERFLEPARAMLEDHAFWQHQGEGLAVFLSADAFRYWRLPLPFDELAVVDEHFRVGPLLPLLFDNKKFYILAISKNETKLYRGTHHGVMELRVKDIPHTLAKAMQFVDGEAELAMHPGYRTREKKRQIVHGVGENPDLGHVRLFEYFRQIDAGLNEFFGERHDPLILAAIDRYFPIYRRANTYPALMSEGIPGNPEHRRPEQLHAAAWRIVEPHFHNDLHRHAERYRLMGKEDPRSNNTKVIVRAAARGRVDTLFLQPDLAPWGTYNDATGAIEIHETARPGDVDLAAYAAFKTYLNKGVVFAVDEDEMPAKSPFAAIFRYRSLE